MFNLLKKALKIISIGIIVAIAVIILLSMLGLQSITGSAVGIAKDCTTQCKEKSLTIEEFEKCINNACTIIKNEAPKGITGYIQ